MKANLATTLPRKRVQGCVMTAYDRLPPALRCWLAQAALPWSPESALRIWQRARPDEAAALAALARAEAATLRRDRRAVRAGTASPPDSADGPAKLPKIARNQADVVTLGRRGRRVI